MAHGATKTTARIVLSSSRVPWGSHTHSIGGGTAMAIGLTAKDKKRAKALKRAVVRKGRPSEPPQNTSSAGFAFVVKVGRDPKNAAWRYVTPDYGRSLGTSSVPRAVFPSITPTLHSIWKAAVIDGAFQWDDPFVQRDTLRLVEVHLSSRDVTERLFPDDEAFADSVKMAALAKLSPAEARVLGLETEYTMLRIVQSNPSENETEELTGEGRQQLEEIGLTRLN
ncbi:hypothetical protein IPV08_16120 [Methylobacterium sp. SD274]|uniref:hypothetical protein n=1 Tax=Methylobacterium sp. SD274 TaxID=2782009 RepID=UPI001A964377|nr:hypothetical protein [Methylobacterium sp. SD274]MBO1021487.1 hypothetical protein [Methylobacterium sp. SD274]